MFGNSPNCPPDRLLIATDMQPILAVMRSADAGQLDGCPARSVQRHHLVAG